MTQPETLNDTPVMDRKARHDPLVIGARVLVEDESETGTITKTGMVEGINAQSVHFRDDDGNKWCAPRAITKVMRAA